MKKFIYFLPTLLLSGSFVSCDTPAQKDYHRAAYATICSYSVNNYEKGDRIVFECSKGYLDTLEVRQVTSKFSENRLSGDDGSDSSNRYAETIVFLHTPADSEKAVSVTLDLYLYRDEEYELDGEVIYYDFLNSETNAGCMFRKTTIPTEKIWRTDYVGAFTSEETFAEVKKDVGLYTFRNNVGTVWTFKKRLK